MTVLKKKMNDNQVAVIIKNSTKPTIIALYQENSFGEVWMNKLLKEIAKEYPKKIGIYSFPIEYQPTLIIYFVKKKEVKAQLLGSTSQKIFKETLRCILD